MQRSDGAGFWAELLRAWNGANGPLIDARSNGGFIRKSIGGNQRGEKGLIEV